jgi:WD40 repeat protein
VILWKWNARTGKTSPEPILVAPSQVNSVAFSPDGGMLASGSVGGWVQLWDAHTASFLRTLATNQHNLSAVTFSPDGKMLDSGH